VAGTSPEPEVDGPLGPLAPVRRRPRRPAHSGHDEKRRQRGPAAHRARAGAGTFWVDVDGHWQLGPFTARGPSLRVSEYRRGCARRRRRGASRRWPSKSRVRRRSWPSSTPDAAVGFVRSEAGGCNEQSGAGDDKFCGPRPAIVEAGSTAAALVSGSLSRDRVANRRQTLDAAARYATDAAQDLGIAAWVPISEASRTRSARIGGPVAGLWPTGRHHASVANQAARAWIARGGGGLRGAARRAPAQGAERRLERLQSSATRSSSRSARQSRRSWSASPMLARPRTVQSELKRTRDARRTARVSEALARQGVIRRLNTYKPTPHSVMSRSQR